MSHFTTDRGLASYRPQDLPLPATQIVRASLPYAQGTRSHLHIQQNVPTPQSQRHAQGTAYHFASQHLQDLPIPAAQVVRFQGLEADRGARQVPQASRHYTQGIRSYLQVQPDAPIPQSQRYAQGTGHHSQIQLNATLPHTHGTANPLALRSTSQQDLRQQELVHRPAPSRQPGGGWQSYPTASQMAHGDDSQRWKILFTQAQSRVARLEEEKRQLQQRQISAMEMIPVDGKLTLHNNGVLVCADVAREVKGLWREIEAFAREWADPEPSQLWYDLAQGPHQNAIAYFKSVSSTTPDGALIEDILRKWKPKLLVSALLSHHVVEKIFQRTFCMLEAVPAGLEEFEHYLRREDLTPELLYQEYDLPKAVKWKNLTLEIIDPSGVAMPPAWCQSAAQRRNTLSRRLADEFLANQVSLLLRTNINERERRERHGGLEDILRLAFEISGKLKKLPEHLRCYTYFNLRVEPLEPNFVSVYPPQSLEQQLEGDHQLGHDIALVISPAIALVGDSEGASLDIVTPVVPAVVLLDRPEFSGSEESSTVFEEDEEDVVDLVSS